LYFILKRIRPNDYILTRACLVYSAYRAGSQGDHEHEGQRKARGRHLHLARSGISGQAIQVRGYNLYITGISTLLQVVLMRRNQNEKVLESALDSIHEAEDLIRVKNQGQAGARLLASVRDTLGKMVGR
jgi:hypothetical protein